MRKVSTVMALFLLSGTALFASAQMDEGMAPDVDADALAVAEHDVLGSYLVDDDGRTLYVVVDGDASVPCEGDCAEAWPPYLLDDMDEGMNASGMDGEAMDDEAMDDEAMDDEMGASGIDGDDMQEGDMDGAMVEGNAVDPSLIGTATRADGSTQATYDGHPLYYFVNDVEPGEVNCQAVAQFGGTWYVLAPDGEIVRTAP